MQELQYGDAVLKENEHFKIVKDKFGNEHKVAIATHPIWMPKTEGLIQLVANRKDEERVDSERNSRFRSCYDPASGLRFGINPHIDTFTGQLDFANIPMGHVLNFDLADPIQRAQWACISRSPDIENGVNQKGRSRYKVLDLERKAAMKLETRKERRKASNIFDTLDALQRRDMAISLGINPEAYSSVGLEGELAGFIEDSGSSNYKKFLDVWEAPNRDTIITFKRAVKTGVISYSSIETRVGNSVNQRGYYYNAIHLGNNEEGAINFLSNSENVTLCGSINVMALEREKNTKLGASRQKVINTTPVVSPNSSNESVLKANYEAQLASMKLELEELRKEKEFKRDAVTKQETKTPSPTTDPISINEFNALKQEAKALGVAGWKFFKEKDVETLKTKIAEKKQVVAE